MRNSIMDIRSGLKWTYQLLDKVALLSLLQILQTPLQSFAHLYSPPKFKQEL